MNVGNTKVSGKHSLMLHDKTFQLILHLLRQIAIRVSRVCKFRISARRRDPVREEDAIFASMLIEGGIDVPEGVAFQELA
jgi:hypothetical protein